MRWIEKRRLSAESGFWKTIWSARTSSASRLAVRPASAWPSSSITEPSSGSVRPSRRRASVVLPLPDSPTSPSVSPGRSASAMSCTAWISWPSCLNVLRSPSARTTGAASWSTTVGTGAADVARGRSSRLLPEVAAADAAAARVVQRRLLRAADVLGHRAAVDEDARGQVGAERRAGGPGSCPAALRPCARRRAGCSAAGRPCTDGAGRRRRGRPAPPRRARPA